jgi:hypothetical protein
MLEFGLCSKKKKKKTQLSLIIQYSAQLDYRPTVYGLGWEICQLGVQVPTKYRPIFESYDLVF